MQDIQSRILDAAGSKGINGKGKRERERVRQRRIKTEIKRKKEKLTIRGSKRNDKEVSVKKGDEETEMVLWKELGKRGRNEKSYNKIVETGGPP